MKKVLVITNHGYGYIGGVEFYNTNLYQSFPNIHFFELSTLDSLQSIGKKTLYENVTKANGYVKQYAWLSKTSKIWVMKLISKYAKIYLRNKAIEKKATGLILENNFSKIIISSSYFTSRKFFKKHKDKIYFVQHSHPLHYFRNYVFSPTLNKHIKKSFIYEILTLNLIRKFDFFRNSLNIVAFDEANKNIIEKQYKNKNIFTICPSSKFASKEKKVEKRYDFICPMRFAKIKNIEAIAKFAKTHTRYRFFVCGEGELKHELEGISNLELSGPLGFEALQQKFLQSWFQLSMSHCEGFPLSASESLSLGIPCILPNSFPSATFLVGEHSERGFLFDLNDDYMQKIDTFITDLKSYDVLSNNAFDFANEHLSLSVFKEGWSKILNKN